MKNTKRAKYGQRPIPESITFDDSVGVAKKYINGRCYAVRFAPGMTVDAMIASFKRDYPSHYEWNPFDEGSNTFL